LKFGGGYRKHGNLCLGAVSRYELRMSAVVAQCAIKRCEIRTGRLNMLWVHGNRTSRRLGGPAELFLMRCKRLLADRDMWQDTLEAAGGSS
jgi:hypothetical protein